MGLAGERGFELFALLREVIERLSKHLHSRLFPGLHFLWVLELVVLVVLLSAALEEP